jgi:hypothetical protein
MPARTGIHAANLAKSPRLQRALKALQDNPGGLTTRQWIQVADICACNSVAAELRAAGIPVECSFVGRSVHGSSVFKYRLS